MSSETLLDGIADRAAEIDEIAEDTARAHNAAWQALMLSPEGRDPVIWGRAWETLIAPLGLMAFEDWVLLDMADYASAPNSVGKPILWGATIAASRAQADVVLYRALLPVLDQHAAAQNRDAGRLGKSALKAAAKVGPGKERFKAASEARRGRR